MQRGQSFLSQVSVWRGLPLASVVFYCPDIALLEIDGRCVNCWELLKLYLLCAAGGVRIGSPWPAARPVLKYWIFLCGCCCPVSLNWRETDNTDITRASNEGTKVREYLTIPEKVSNYRVIIGSCQIVDTSESHKKELNHDFNLCLFLSTSYILVQRYHTWHNVEKWVIYSDKKIGKQIAGYKVELCKSKTTTKPVLLQTIRMVYRGRVIIHR